MTVLYCYLIKCPMEGRKQINGTPKRKQHMGSLGKSRAVFRYIKAGVKGGLVFQLQGPDSALSCSEMRMITVREDRHNCLGFEIGRNGRLC